MKPTPADVNVRARVCLQRRGEFRNICRGSRSEVLKRARRCRSLFRPARRRRYLKQPICSAVGRPTCVHGDDDIYAARPPAHPPARLPASSLARRRRRRQNNRSPVYRGIYLFFLNNISIFLQHGRLFLVLLYLITTIRPFSDADFFSLDTFSTYCNRHLNVESFYFFFLNTKD